MSYNNGLVPAMNARELTNAMRRAVSNPWRSGVRDVFGSYAPIVRPQEMMTTPGIFSFYKHLGIQAVALFPPPISAWPRHLSPLNANRRPTI